MLSIDNNNIQIIFVLKILNLVEVYNSFHKSSTYLLINTSNNNMKKYIYLSITPEALIGSMIPPAEFGEYLATGTKKRNKGQAIFFEVDPDLMPGLINQEYLDRRCVRKSDGSPKHSVYLSVYKVLESVPLKAFKNLYLTTESGVVLELKQKPYDQNRESKGSLHLYQELCPVNPQIASVLTPSQFLKELTDDSKPVSLPKLFFVDLKLDELATNPLTGSAEHLPYPSIGHLRDCLEILKNETEKSMKTVQRFYHGALLYRTIKTGFYVGDKNEMLFYPYPSMSELEDMNYEFLRAI